MENPRKRRFNKTCPHRGGRRFHPNLRLRPAPKALPPASKKTITDAAAQDYRIEPLFVKLRTKTPSYPCDGVENPRSRKLDRRTSTSPSHPSPSLPHCSVRAMEDPPFRKPDRRISTRPPLPPVSLPLRSVRAEPRSQVIVQAHARVDAKIGPESDFRRMATPGRGTGSRSPRPRGWLRSPPTPRGRRWCGRV